MSRLKRATGRVRAFFNKPALDAEVEAELAAHLEMAIEDKIAHGLLPPRPVDSLWSASAGWNKQKTNTAKREDS